MAKASKTSQTISADQWKKLRDSGMSANDIHGAVNSGSLNKNNAGTYSYNPAVASDDSGHLGGYTASETAKKGLEGLNTGSYLSGVQNPWTAKINSNNPFQDYSEDILGYDDWAAKNGYNTASPSIEWNNKVKGAYDQYRQGFFDKDPDYDVKHKKFQDWNDEQARYMQESDKWNEEHAKDAEEYAGQEGLKYLADLGITPDSDDFTWIMSQIYKDPNGPYAHIAESITNPDESLMSLDEAYRKFYYGDDLGPIEGSDEHLYSGGYRDKLAQDEFENHYSKIIPDFDKLPDEEKAYRAAEYDYSNWVRWAKDQYRVEMAKAGKYDPKTGFSDNAAIGEQAFIQKLLETDQTDVTKEARNAYEKMQQYGADIDANRTTSTDSAIQEALNAANQAVGIRTAVPEDINLWMSGGSGANPTSYDYQPEISAMPSFAPAQNEATTFQEKAEAQATKRGAQPYSDEWYSYIEQYYKGLGMKPPER